VIYRSDNQHVLGVMGEGYQIHPYDTWLTEQLGQLVDDANVVVQSAGLLSDGAQAYVQIAAPEPRTGPGGVEYKPFILASSSLDGSVATGYKRNTYVIVCRNTWRASLNRKENLSIKFKHTRGSQYRAGEVRAALEILFETGDQFDRELEQLLSVKVTDDQFKQIVEQLVAPSTDSDRSKGMAERKAGELWQLWRHDERAATWKGTALGAMQAMSTWQQHIASFKGGDREQRNADRLVKGPGDRFDLDARDLIRSVVGA
jgi:phage/plasmid-like protein (TIGR03299 family)